MKYQFRLFRLRCVFALTAIVVLSVVVLRYSDTASSQVTKRPVTVNGERSSVRADGIGGLEFKLQDGYDLSTNFPSDEIVAQNSRPRGLVSVDFDVDGFPDLVSAYATENGGYLTYYRANPEALAPTQPETIEGIKRSEFPNGFLPEAKVIELSSSPDFIAAGDFNGDTDADIVVASRGGQEIYLIAGDGKGNLQKPQKVSIDGNVTALTAGQIDLPDNLTDLIVAVEAGSLLVFEGGIFAKPEIYSLPASATQLALGQLDDSPTRDLAIVADGEVFVLHGRNQRENQALEIRLERVSLPVSVKALALGEFIWDRDSRTEMALLSEDGMIHIAKQGTLDVRPFTTAEMRERRRQMFEHRSRNEIPAMKEWSGDSPGWDVAENFAAMSDTSGFADGTSVLMNAHLSNQMAHDLLIVDSAANQLRIFTVDAPEKVDGEFVSFGGERRAYTLDVGSSPVAAISMRLHLHIRPGIVLLREGQKIPTMIPSAPQATFTVTKQTDTNDGFCNADCSLREAVVAANGAAGADLVVLPTGTHTLSIANGGGANEDNGAQGDLDVNQDITFSGNGPANTIIQAGTTNANGIDKIAGFNPICTSSVASSINGATFRFGRNTQPFGGGDFGYLGGGLDWCNIGAAVTSLAITNTIISDNTNVDGVGGGMDISAAPGDTSTVTITGTTFNNNTSARVAGAIGGAGVFVASANVTFTNCQITNNQITGSGEGAGMRFEETATHTVSVNGTTVSGNTSSSRGGGIAFTGFSGGNLTLSIAQDSVISGNTSVGSASGTAAEGGGIYGSSVGGTITINEVTITGNAANGATPGQQRGGGGLAFGGITGGATTTVSFSRIVNNTALGSLGGTGLHKDLNGGTITATNNWWGCNGGPNTAGCQTIAVNGGGVSGGTVNSNPWLVMRHSASPTALVTGQTSTMTADFLRNSANAVINVSDLDAMIGTTITFNNAVRGNLSGAQTTIQAAGTATATYTATTAGAGSADAVVDGQTMTVNFINSAAATTASISADMPDPSNVGQNVTVSYSVSVTSPGAGTPTGNVQVSDGVNSCTGTVAAGQCTVALTTAGNRTLTATYQGDGNYAASPASPGASHVVGQVTWTGATNTTFSTNTNWNTGLAPGSGDTVIIPAGAGNQPTISGAASVSSLSVASGRTLSVNSSLTVSGTLTNNGTIQGTGTIVNNFTNGASGIVAPGLSPGILNITGNYINTGAFNVEIGGTGGAGVNPNGHDQLLVSGTATIGGTLNVTLTNGFTPVPGNQFVILDAATSSGTFATVNLPNIAPNQWAFGYDNANGRIVLGVVPVVAAAVSVSGRILSPDGKGIGNARVLITDANGATRTVRSNSFGNYRIEGVATGQTYTISVAAKGYRFTPRALTVSQDVSDADFRAEDVP